MWETLVFRRALLRPLTSQFAHYGRATPIDGRLHESEDRTLQRRRREYLAPSTVFVGGVRRIVVAGNHLPDLLEREPRDRAGGRAEQQTDRFVGQLGNLATHRRLPRITRMIP